MTRLIRRSMRRSNIRGYWYRYRGRQISDEAEDEMDRLRDELRLAEEQDHWRDAGWPMDDEEQENEILAVQYRFPALVATIGHGRDFLRGVHAIVADAAEREAEIRHKEDRKEDREPSSSASSSVASSVPLYRTYLYDDDDDD